MLSAAHTPALSAKVSLEPSPRPRFPQQSESECRYRRGVNDRLAPRESVFEHFPRFIQASKKRAATKAWVQGYSWKGVMEFKSDIEIAQSTEMLPIEQIAKDIGIDHEDIELYGKFKAKIDFNLYEAMKAKQDGKHLGALRD